MQPYKTSFPHQEQLRSIRSSKTSMERVTKHSLISFVLTIQSMIPTHCYSSKTDPASNANANWSLATSMNMSITSSWVLTWQMYPSPTLVIFDRDMNSLTKHMMHATQMIQQNAQCISIAQSCWHAWVNGKTYSSKLSHFQQPWWKPCAAKGTQL